MTVVALRRAEPGLLVIAPEGTPLVTDAAPALDVMVLEVIGGHLSWDLFDGTDLPAAVLDDVAAAQDWVWAVYGEAVALAADGIEQRTLTATPARPGLLRALRRLAYAHWASRWWPASTVDGVPALDHRLLLEEIESLTGTCDMAVEVHNDRAGLLVDEFHGIERVDDASSTETSDHDVGPSDDEVVPGGRPHGTADAHDDSAGRATDYALAAGRPDQGDGLIIARGTGGWDWRRCPPGILDASEHAVSWQVTRAAGVSTVRISVVAAPDCRGVVPEHLRPLARVRSWRAQPAVTEQGPSPSAAHDRARPLPTVDAEVPLHLRGDAWTAGIDIAGPPEIPLDITVFVPGVGPAAHVAQPDVQDRIRRFARLRLSASTDDRLSAEAAAADRDEDF
ncbi:MAG: hypothetical protein H5T78_06930 [Nocardia sp.]|nr:hypothetical protein [Nocardia sp.]